MIDATKLPIVPSERTQSAPTVAIAGAANGDIAAVSVQPVGYPAKAMVLQHGRYYATDEKK